MNGEAPGREASLLPTQMGADDAVAVDNFVLDPDGRAHGTERAHTESGVVIASAACSAPIDASSAATRPSDALAAAAASVAALTRKLLPKEDEPDGTGEAKGLVVAAAARNASRCAACRCRAVANRPAVTASSAAIARS